MVDTPLMYRISTDFCFLQFVLLVNVVNGRTYATVLCCVRRLSVCTECIVVKRFFVEQKLLLTAYSKSYIRNRLVPKWMTLTFV